jgi:hypothetical protein
MSGGIPPLPEAEAVAQRAKLREALKAEFRKQITHPFRGEGPMVIFRIHIQSTFYHLLIITF